MPPRAAKKSAKLKEAEEHKDFWTKAANVKRPRGRPRKNAPPDPPLILTSEVTTRQTKEKAWKINTKIVFFNSDHQSQTNKRARKDSPDNSDEVPGDKSIYDVALASGLEVSYEDTDEYIETPDSPDKTKPAGDEIVFETGVSYLLNVQMGKC